MIRRLMFYVAFAMVFSVGSAQAILLDVFKTSGSGASFSNPVGQISTIDTAQTAAQHYNFFSASGHPSGVPLGPNAANVWVHQNTNNGDLGFGFIFGQDGNATPTNTASLNFRVVNSATPLSVVVSDDPGEAVETLPDTFVGNFIYGNNSDGIMIDGLSGSFTIILDSVDFGSITTWNAASGDSSHLSLELGEEYRITLAGELPSGAPVTGVVEPGTLMVFGAGLFSMGLMRRRQVRTV